MFFLSLPFSIATYIQKISFMKRNYIIFQYHTWCRLHIETVHASFLCVWYTGLCAIIKYISSSQNTTKKKSEGESSSQDLTRGHSLVTRPWRLAAELSRRWQTPDLKPRPETLTQKPWVTIRSFFILLPRPRPHLALHFNDTIASLL